MTKLVGKMYRILNNFLFYKLYKKIRLFAPSYHAQSHLLILKFVNIGSCNIILHKLN